MNKKQISTIVGALIAVASALGFGGYSLGTQSDPPQSNKIETLAARMDRMESRADENSRNLSTRVSKIEDRVNKNGEGIQKILGYLDK